MADMASPEQMAELAQKGDDIRAIQKLLGHRRVRTTMIYTHVLNRGGRGVQSSVDALDLWLAHPRGEGSPVRRKPVHSLGALRAFA